jgi:sulfur-carrier protein
VLVCVLLQIAANPHDLAFSRAHSTRIARDERAKGEWGQFRARLAGYWLEGQQISFCTLPSMATLRLFASAREAAGCGSDTFEEKSVGGLLDAAVERFGTPFAEVLATCRVWLNGEEVGRDAALSDSDEVAVLPPVSGGI